MSSGPYLIRVEALRWRQLSAALRDRHGRAQATEGARFATGGSPQEVSMSLSGGSGSLADPMGDHAEPCAFARAPARGRTKGRHREEPEGFQRGSRLPSEVRRSIGCPLSPERFLAARGEPLRGEITPQEMPAPGGSPNPIRMKIVKAASAWLDFTGAGLRFAPPTPCRDGVPRPCTRFWMERIVRCTPSTTTSMVTRTSTRLRRLLRRAGDGRGLSQRARFSSRRALCRLGSRQVEPR